MTVMYFVFAVVCFVCKLSLQHLHQTGVSKIQFCAATKVCVPNCVVEPSIMHMTPLCLLPTLSGEPTTCTPV